VFTEFTTFVCCLLVLSPTFVAVGFCFAADGLCYLTQWHKCRRWLELFAFTRRVGYVERSNEPEWATAELYSTALVLPCKTSIVRVLDGFT
jgi:hypothetical protein